MFLAPSIPRRRFLECMGAMATVSALPDVLSSQHNPQQRQAGPQRFSRPGDHSASAKTAVVTSTSREASEAALWALTQGGNAADASLTATLTQTVVEHGLTSVAGGFAINGGRICFVSIALWTVAGTATR